MCYMAVYGKNVEPQLDHLQNAILLNPSGYGWSVGTEQVYHGLNGEIAVGEFMRARRSNMEATAIFHARHLHEGSAPVSLANCQPFVLEDGSILAHNGAMFPVKGTTSDTRIFAEHFLPHWDLDSDKDRLQLGCLLGRNKIVVVRPDGKVPVLLGDRFGVWLPDGSWHSNADKTGISHLAAGQCGTCGKAVEGAPESFMCPECTDEFKGRRAVLQLAVVHRAVPD